jgi:competence protein ComFB
MAFLENYDFQYLKNEAENLVLQELERQLDAYSAPLCRCNDCVLDMAAMALNSIKPLYRVSLLGGLYTATAMDQKVYGTMVRESVFNAIEKVRSNPGHEIEDSENNG